MNISSQAFGYKQRIPIKYTCEGANASPPLMFSGISARTASLALIVDDVDAPSGIYTHWVLYNIKPDVTSVPENGIPPESAQGVNSAGHMHYDGPCPPEGTHRYVFRLYSLDSVLNLNPGVSRQDLEAAMHGHILEQAELTGMYERSGEQR